MFLDKKTQQRLAHRIDPDARNLRGLQKRLARIFPERQIIMRTGERMRTLRLSTLRQTVAAGVMTVLGIWLLTSSGLVMGHNESIRAKNQEVSQAQDSYEQLLAQVSLYRQKVTDITTNLEQNFDQTIALVEEQAGLASMNTPEGLLKQAARQERPSKEALAQAAVPPVVAPAELEVALGNTQLERAHFEEERLRLRDRLGRLEGELLDLEQPQSAAAVAAAETRGVGGVEYRRTVLERDLALAERQEYAARVDELEAIVSEMESTQLLLFHKFSELADANITHIEDSLSRTGLDVGNLLDKRSEEKPSIGQGGPFIPLSVVPDQGGPLQKSLMSLNTKIDHWTALRDLLIVMPLAKPMKKYWLTSGFGVRKDPFNGRFARHNGLDFGGRYGSPILSPGEAKVVYAGWRGRYGRFVELDHGMGIRTRFGHMSKVSVSKGDIVGRGTEVGRLGSSGRSSGPHLHYEVLVGGSAVDPLKFIKAGSDVFED